MASNEEHRRLRELLGAYALGHLDEVEADRLRSHLDGCPSCRAELGEIAPLAGLLDGIDAAHFDLPALPPGDLGARIRSQVAGERELQESDELRLRRDRSRRRAAGRGALGAVAAAVVLAVLVGGAVLGRSTAPDAAAPEPTATITVTQAPPVTLEPVTLSSATPAITIETSGLVAHTWGVELRMTGRGFEEGAVFQAAFRSSETGELETAGAFIGTGGKEMTCNLQSALMRAEASEVVVTDADGAVVLTAPL